MDPRGRGRCAEDLDVDLSSAMLAESSWPAQY